MHAPLIRGAISTCELGAETTPLRPVATTLMSLSRTIAPKQ
jgi:hypothetical protein